MNNANFRTLLLVAAVLVVGILAFQMFDRDDGVEIRAPGVKIDTK